MVFCNLFRTHAFNNKYMRIDCMTLEDEKNIVKKARKDPEAFGRLFDEYYPKILGYSLRRVADVNLAKDITSEVFYKAFKNL